jgi:acyl dehydratase
MAETIEWGFPSGTWDDAEAQVGKEIGSFEGPDEVNKADIRRRLEVFSWDCPIHVDDEVARAHGYEGIVAPASMHMVWALPSYWAPGEPRHQELQHRFMTTIPMVMNVPGEGSGMVDTECEVEYFEPVYPGDEISATSKILSVVRKKTSIGDGAFVVVESTYKKATGEIVAIDRLTLYRYHPKGETDVDAN